MMTDFRGVNLLRFEFLMQSPAISYPIHVTDAFLCPDSHWLPGAHLDGCIAV